TPVTDTLYLAGSFNEWHPGNKAYAFKRGLDGKYQGRLPATVTGTVEFKVTRGTWAKVETDAQNSEIRNRTYHIGSKPAALNIKIENWKDLAEESRSCVSTALQPNVCVVNTEFPVPQLRRTRRIWVYLPNDYEVDAVKRYPVLYLHDGQNVFDACTSFSGEWGVDETLSQLQQQGLDGKGCIVIAIDNGGQERLNELSPWRNPAYGGGQGDQYVDFLVQTLKPYVDANYRTLTGREYTGIAGSSMGGLISTYAALKYPLVYSKVGVFSPAFWFAEKELFTYLRQHAPHADTRFYFVSGTKESETMVPLMQAVRDSLAHGGMAATYLQYVVRTDGQHAEWFWKREFAAAYQWLYGSATVDATRPAKPLQFSAYFNSDQSKLLLQLPPATRVAQLEIIVAGRRVMRRKVHTRDSVDVTRLPAGHYLLRIASNRKWGSQLLVKR
ncbi:MAG TPA: alpha/beta hydrolase-fold protein, partial [Hymenobacter sp.]|nr:alpha/beta hydrolase-fold protein [Hymenobacter sp.]